MARYELNEAAVAYARSLIDAKQYVLDSDWGEAQPDAETENAYLAGHSWDDYAACCSTSTRPLPETGRCGRGLAGGRASPRRQGPVGRGRLRA